MSESKRKYDTAFRKRVSSRIQEIKEKQVLTGIFRVMKGDIGEKYMNNKNGIFFDMNTLNDCSIERIDIIVNNYLAKQKEATGELRFQSYCNDDDYRIKLKKAEQKLLNKF